MSAGVVGTVTDGVKQRQFALRDGMEDQLVNNRAMSRFELPITDEASAVVYYSIENGRVVLRHTEVPFEFGGQGYGTRLARAVFDKLRSERKRVTATCPFMALFAARNPQYAAMLDG
jgi:hypothetical protein